MLGDDNGDESVQQQQRVGTMEELSSAGSSGHPIEERNERSRVDSRMGNHVPSQNYGALSQPQQQQQQQLEMISDTNFHEVDFYGDDGNVAHQMSAQQHDLKPGRIDEGGDG